MVFQGATTKRKIQLNHTCKISALLSFPHNAEDNYFAYSVSGEAVTMICFHG